MCHLSLFSAPVLLLLRLGSPLATHPHHPLLLPRIHPLLPPSRTCPVAASLSTTSASTHILTQNLYSLSFHPSLLLSQDQIVLPFQAATPNLPVTLVSCSKSSILSTVHINFFPSTVLIPLGPWSTDSTLYVALAFRVSGL